MGLDKSIFLCGLIFEGAVLDNKNEKPKQALCIASVASNLDNFNRNNVDILQGLGYEVTLAANFHSKEDINSQEKINSFAKEMRAKGVHVVHIDFARSLKKIGMQIKSILQVKKLLERRFALIHCHSPICAAIVRAEANKYRKKCGTEVFYTAHGFHFFKGAPLKNWLIFYPAEKWMSRYTDVLITINHEDYNRAKKEFRARKIVYIPGIGVDTEKFRPCSADVSKTRRGIGLKKDDIMLVSVGQLSTGNNHKLVMEALGKMQDRRLHYFIAGIGSLEEEYRVMAINLGIADNIHFLGDRTDISDLCQAADLYIFPSLQEAASVELMEAISSKTPVICSNICGNVDLIQDESFLFNPKDIDSLLLCLKDKIGMGKRDGIKNCAQECVEKNYESLGNYDFGWVEALMEKFYEKHEGRIELFCLKTLLIRKALQKQFNIGSSGFLLLTVGELNDNKNQELAIRAIAELKKDGQFEGVHLLICGIGRKRKYLEKLTYELGIKKYVHFLGFRDELEDIYRAVDEFIFTSKREGLPVALMEAMSSGLPCIVAEARGNTDLVQNNCEGYVVGYDIDEVKEAIIKSINEGKREQLGRSALLKMKSYSKEHVMRKMHRLYGLGLR